MADTNKTKAEILQELESIKGLLLEEDDIPILQVIDKLELAPEQPPTQTHYRAITPAKQHESVLPGQVPLFDEHSAAASHGPRADSHHPDIRKPGFAAHLSDSQPTGITTSAQAATARPLAKAAGENPFLPQHIRERLHGNNPPPLFEYETAKKIISATKNMANKINKPRQALVDDVIHGLMPQIEAELRHRLFAMSVEELEQLLNEDED